MGMPAEEQSKFVRENLGPAFRDFGIKSKILVFDHNWDQIEFPVTVLDDTKAAAYAAVLRFIATEEPSPHRANFTRVFLQRASGSRNAPAASGRKANCFRKRWS